MKSLKIRHLLVGLGLVVVMATSAQSQFVITLRDTSENRWITGNCVVQTLDGGLAALGTWDWGSNADLLLSKFDASGNYLWTRILRGSGKDLGASLTEASDGGLVVTGCTQSFGADSEDVLLAKFDSSGTHLWTKRLGGPSNDRGYSVVRVSDEGFVVAGRNRGNLLLAKFDASGNRLWARSVGGPDIDQAYSLTEASDGGLVVAGYTESFGVGGENVFLSEFDHSGNHLWTRTLGGTSGIVGVSVTEVSDEGLVVTGYLLGLGAGEADLVLAKFDAFGTYLWSKLLGGASWDQGNSLIQASDGGLVVTGYTQSFGADSEDLLLAKFDAFGTYLWSKLLGGASWDQGNSLIQASDGRLVVTGYTQSFGAVGYDLLLVKFDFLGNTCLGGNFTAETLTVDLVVDSITEWSPWNPDTATCDPIIMDTVLTVTVVCQNPAVVWTSPTQNELNVPVNANISVTFDIDMDETTINDSTFVVNAWSTGLHQGTINYDSPTKTATLNPTSDFEVGEIVTVVLTTGIESQWDTPMQSSYLWSFTTEVSDQSPGRFTLDSLYRAGYQPKDVFAADLNADGNQDLATANFDSDSLSVLLNNGDGTFTLDSVYPVGDGPYSVKAVDLNGDGNLDLATANYHSGSVSVLLNNGDGTFGSHSLYSADGYPRIIVVADLDGDGDIDVVTANGGGGSVSVLMNNGNGTFSDSVNYPLGPRVDAVCAADLDGDGDIDLTATNLNDRVFVLLNNGGGGFVPDSVYAVGDLPNSIFAADLNGDSDLDLVTANLNSDNVSILINNGDGTFAPHLDYPVGAEPRSVFVADFDGDSHLDLVTTANYTAGPDSLSIVLNNGDGTFAPYLNYVVAVGSPDNVFAADLDGDGDIDLTSGPFGFDVAILFNCLPTGDCNHDDVVNIADVVYLLNYLFGGGTGPDPLKIGDVNCDGVVNIADVVYLINYLFSGGDPPGCC